MGFIASTIALYYFQVRVQNIALQIFVGVKLSINK